MGSIDHRIFFLIPPFSSVQLFLPQQLLAYSSLQKFLHKLSPISLLTSSSSFPSFPPILHPNLQSTKRWMSRMEAKTGNSHMSTMFTCHSHFWQKELTFSTFSNIRILLTSSLGSKGTHG